MALAHLVVSQVSAETLESALARSYAGNPSLNAQRANVRAFDENVPQALGLSRPTITGTADVGISYTEVNAPGGSAESTTYPRGAGVAIQQNLFNGNRTKNRTRQAESQVNGARELLRNTEQTVLLDSATAYMDVLRDTAILNLQRNNVEVIEEQLRQTQERFNVGEVTRTDVAQAESRLAGARSQASAAEATLRSSVARFRQVVGVEPRQLAPGRPVDRLLPRTLEAAVGVGLVEHPQILQALFAVDAAELQVKAIEGELYPSVDLTGRVNRRFGVGTGGSGTADTGTGGGTTGRGETDTFTASVVAGLTVPIYEGGIVYSRTRQAKETVDQRRIEAEIQRDTIRAAVVSAWGRLDAAKAQIIAAQAQVSAGEVALAGTREEARVGQRTTLDVLNAQQELLNARVNLITAQRDRVVASYSVAQAMGRLNTRLLGINVAQYSAKQHFDQVKDLWYGVRTPDGR